MDDYQETSKQVFDYISWLLITTALILVLKLHLLPALLAGLIVHELISTLSLKLQFIKGITGHGSKIITVALLAVVVILSVSFLSFLIVDFFRNSTGSLPALLKKMADIIDNSLNSLPAWITNYLPSNTEGFKTAASEWLRLHAGQLQTAGKEVARIAAHILMGMAIGALAALNEVKEEQVYGPLAQSLIGSVSRLALSFRNVVFAQVGISAVNTVFSALYLAVALPMFGIHLNLTKTLILLTFIAGLLPVVGNLISNTAIIVVSLNYSFNVSIASLAFLVVIHKLEYFLNAKLVGSRTHSAAWEILLAIIFMEASFGMAGVIAAPIYYAYFKNELSNKKLI